MATVTSSGTPGSTSGTDNSIIAPLINNLMNNYLILAGAVSGSRPAGALQIKSVRITYTLGETQ